MEIPKRPISMPVLDERDKLREKDISFGAANMTALIKMIMVWLDSELANSEREVLRLPPEEGSALLVHLYKL